MDCAVQNEISTALRLFASIFYREADGKLIGKLQAQGAGLVAALGGDPLIGLDMSDPETVLEGLAVEYCRLFIGPRNHLPPTESVVLGEGRFWGNATEEVSAYCRSVGIASAPDINVLPDHISMELDCLAVLEEQGRCDEAVAFANKHIRRWLPALAAYVDEHATLPFYPVWCKGLHAMLLRLYGEDR